MQKSTEATSRFNVQNRRRERFWRYAPLVFWIGLVLFLSSGQGSMSNTSRIIHPLLQFLFPEIADASILLVQIYIRKTAHFVLYFGLGFLAARAFFFSTKEFLKRNWFLASLALTVLLAAIDEINQSFNDARTGSAFDVLLDTAGGLTAIWLWLIFDRIRKRN